MKTDITTRKCDGKFNLWGYCAYPEHDQSTIDETLNESHSKYVPMCWMILGVYYDKQTAIKYARQVQDISGQVVQKSKDFG